MQNHKIIPSIYAEILESIDSRSIINGYFGGSNLLANHLNDWSEIANNAFVAEFLQENASKLDTDDIEEILHNPDHIINSASSDFYNALCLLFNGDGEKAEYILRHANTWFDSWGKYYLFANVDVFYLIRAENDSEVYNELVTRFEKSFVIDEEDIQDSDSQEYNDNGNPINTDYLMLIGSFEFTKAK